MSDEVIAETRWLSLRVRHYSNRRGESREWSYATRPGFNGAVCVVAIIPETLPKIVLIRQNRPPVGAPVIEFPAGLIDEGEAPEVAAIRELREETGYVGLAEQIGPPVFTSPGLTDETIRFVRVTVQSQEKQRLEDDEEIEVLIWPLNELTKNLNQAESRGEAIDARLWIFAHAASWLS